MTRPRRNIEKLEKAAKELVLLIIITIIAIVGIKHYMDTRYSWEEVYETYYHSYRISYGDTVEDIAQLVNQYNDNMNYEQTLLEIGRLNEIDIDNIDAGDYLVLPYTNEAFLEVVE